MKDTGCGIGPISGGCFTTIVSPDGMLMADPLCSGEGEVIIDLDFDSPADAQAFLEKLRGVWSRAELSPGLARTQGANRGDLGPPAGPQARIVQEIDARAY